MQQLPLPFFAIACALFGLIFGSFANVVIWRFPRGVSVVDPPSACPGCGARIHWQDNIPLLSFLMLRGRCRACRELIPVRYPVIEALIGALWATGALAFGVSLRTVFVLALFWLLVVLSAIDIDTYRLPNPLVGLLAAVGLAGVAISATFGIPVLPIGGEGRAFVFAGIGVLLGGGVPALVAAAYGAIRGRSGLGMGDIKLLGALGFFLGPYVLLALMAGSLAGAVGGLAAARGEAIASKRIPFGPYLAAGAAMTVLAGPAAFQWYLRVIGVGG